MTLESHPRHGRGSERIVDLTVRFAVYCGVMYEVERGVCIHEHVAELLPPQADGAPVLS